MNDSFYLFALKFRGSKGSEGAFAEAMFHDHSFPKNATTFSTLSSYIEDLADDEMNAVTFDTLWSIYEEKYFSNY